MRTQPRLVGAVSCLPCPMACRFSELVVDCRDPEALAAFWAAVLDYRVLGREEDGAVEIGPEAGLRRPRARRWSSARSTTRRRASCGCTSTSTPPTATRTPSSSGCSVWAPTRADVGQTGDEGWHVLADPEGNEFCLLKRRLDPL